MPYDKVHLQRLKAERANGKSKMKAERANGKGKLKAERANEKGKMKAERANGKGKWKDELESKRANERVSEVFRKNKKGVCYHPRC
jgi:hypothetical protein